MQDHFRCFFFQELLQLFLEHVREEGDKNVLKLVSYAVYSIIVLFETLTA